MSTNSRAAVPSSGDIPPEVLADAEAVAPAVSDGRKVDPDVARRVQERAAKARRENLATHGVQNIGVDISRELRGERPAQ